MKNYLVVYMFSKGGKTSVGNVHVKFKDLTLENIKDFEDAIKEEQGYGNIVITNIVELEG